jgi:hypothetical protein
VGTGEFGDPLASAFLGRPAPSGGALAKPSGSCSREAERPRWLRRGDPPVRRRTTSGSGRERIDAPNVARESSGTFSSEGCRALVAPPAVRSTMSSSSPRRISMGTGAPLAALSTTHLYSGIDGIGTCQTTRRSLSSPGRGQPARELHTEAVRFPTSARRRSVHRRAGMPLAHSGWRRRAAGPSLASERLRLAPEDPENPFPTWSPTTSASRPFTRADGR